VTKQINLAIGSYTEFQDHVPNACGEGITIISFDETEGLWGDFNILGDLKNPSYLEWDSMQRHLYAITESNEGAGLIQVYKTDNNYQPVSSIPGPGRAGCHLRGDFSNNMMYAVSYTDGTLKAYTLEKGVPVDQVFHHRFEGSGPDRNRQEKAHAHQVLFYSDSPYLYVCDLGSDRIWVGSRQREKAAFQEALIVPSGYGPRHLAFDHSGEYVFILCELNPHLLVAKINQTDGSLEIVQDLPTVDSRPFPLCAPAAVKVHPSGKTVAVSNRFDDSITVFQIKRKEKKVSLEYFQNFSSKGKTPRDITFCPSGRWLLIANQDSGDIQVKAFDPETGVPLERWSEPLNTGSPVCIISLD